jgi:hypothetical protein
MGCGKCPHEEEFFFYYYPCGDFGHFFFFSLDPLKNRINNPHTALKINDQPAISKLLGE